MELEKGSSTVGLTDSQAKTAKSCMNMFTKWQGKTEETNKTVTRYINACIGGYPNGAQFTPGLLAARVRGIEKSLAHNLVEGITIKKGDIAKAKELIARYKEQRKAEKNPVKTTEEE